MTLTPVSQKPIEMSFSAEKISLDEGLLLLCEIEARNGIFQFFTNCIKEDCHSGYENNYTDLFNLDLLKYMNQGLKPQVVNSLIVSKI